MTTGLSISSIAGLKANVSEAEHPLLCEGTRRQRGDLAISLLVHYKSDQAKLTQIMDKLLDKEVHCMYKMSVINQAYHAALKPVTTVTSTAPSTGAASNGTREESTATTPAPSDNGSSLASLLVLFILVSSACSVLFSRFVGQALASQLGALAVNDSGGCGRKNGNTSTTASSSTNQSAGGLANSASCDDLPSGAATPGPSSIRMRESSSYSALRLVSFGFHSCDISFK